MSEIRITLPLPSVDLSPNARVYWAKKSKSTKLYRTLARFEAGKAMIHLNRSGHPWDAAEVQATFYHKVKRKRDRDNALASLKSAFDGIADAKVIRDDSGLTHKPVQFGVDKSNPRLELIIRKIG